MYDYFVVYIIYQSTAVGRNAFARPKCKEVARSIRTTKATARLARIGDTSFCFDSDHRFPDSRNIDVSHRLLGHSYR